MKVSELITRLQDCDQDAEVNWEMGSRDLNLLIGEDPDTGETVTIERSSRY